MCIMYENIFKINEHDKKDILFENNAFINFRNLNVLLMTITSQNHFYAHYMEKPSP